MHLVRENYKKYYSAGNFSTACLFCGFMNFIIILIPFFLAFTTHNFWIIQKTTYEQPKLEYSKNYLIQLYTTDGTTNNLKVATNIPDIQSQQLGVSQYITNPIVSVTPIHDSTDENTDIVDKYNIKVQLGEKNSDIKAFSSLFFFRVVFDDTVNLAFQSYIHVYLEAINGLSQAHVIGDIGIKQNTPIYAGSIQRTAFDTEPYIDSNGQVQSEIRHIIETNHYRNETLGFDYQTVIIPQSGEDLATINIEMFIPKYTPIQYVPLITETMKFAWNQYFCFFLLFFLAGRFFMRYFYSTGILVTAKKDDLPKKAPSQHKCKIE